MVPTVEQLSGDLHPHLALLRAESPVAWVPAIGTWLVTGRNAALEVMRDAERFTVDDPRFTTGRVVGPSMLSLDGAEHDRHRAAFAAAFRPAVSRKRMATRTHELAAGLVAGLVGEPASELRTALATPLAAEVIIEMLGLVDTTIADVVGWYAAIVAEVSSLTLDATRPANTALMDELRAAVSRSLHSPASDLSQTAERSGLTEEEFASNVAVVMFGALETSEAMIANLLWHVLRDPDLAARLRDVPDLRDRAIDESLRLEPGAAVVDRYVVAATRISGVTVGAGDPVSVSLAGANRDPAVYRDPDRYSLGRDDEPPHLAFAAGPHVCLGAPLARLEARAALDAVLATVPSPVLDRDASTPPTGLVFRKADRIVVDWRSGAASRG